MITEDYVSFEIAKLLKEKGFDEPCECFYDTENNDTSIVNGWMDISNSELEEREFVCYSAPTIQMAMKWLREEKDVQIEISIVGTDTWKSPTKWMYGFRCQTKDVIDRRNADFSSYEEACEAAIKYCIESLI